MTSTSSKDQTIRHHVLEVLEKHPDQTLSIKRIHHLIDSPDISRDQVRGALYAMSNLKQSPVRRAGFALYRYSSRCKAAVALRALAESSQIRSEDLPAPEAVEVSEDPVIVSETTVAVVPDSAPVLGGEWERIKRVPAVITSLMPLKDCESLVVTEDGRYFILSELVS
jgi:hypothetical protein